MSEFWVRFVGADGAPADEPFPVVVRADARVANLKRAIMAECGAQLAEYKAKDLVLSDGAGAAGTLSATAQCASLTAGSPENPLLIGSGSEPSTGQLAPFGEKKATYPDGAEHFGWAALALEVIIVILYGTTTEYDDNTDVGQGNGGSMGLEYAMFQDVHVMIWVGFGFLMVFLKKHSFGSTGFNFFIAAVAVQLTILFEGLFHLIHSDTLDTDKIHIGIVSLITGDFGAAAVLITFGALLGKVNATQMLFVTVWELFFYALNFYIGALEGEAADIGGSMFVHAFGAFFGLGCAWMLGTAAKDHADNGSNKTSDTFAMVGTLFLWVFWPSFCGALAEGSAQQRVVVNTVLSLTGSCMAAFAISALNRHEKKFDMVDIQNATLAGGVAIGTVCDMLIRPWGALTIGLVAGALSVYGYTKISPYLETKFGLYDTCGVLNLHGLPGVLSGVAGIIAVAVAKKEDYGSDMAMFLHNADGSSEGDQVEAQVVALIVTLAIAISSGIVCGAIIRHDNFRPPRVLFDDSLYFTEVSEEHFEAVYKAPGSAAVQPAEEFVADIEAQPVGMQALEVELNQRNI